MSTPAKHDWDFPGLRSVLVSQTVRLLTLPRAKALGAAAFLIGVVPALLGGVMISTGGEQPHRLPETLGLTGVVALGCLGGCSAGAMDSGGEAVTALLAVPRRGILAGARIASLLLTTVPPALVIAVIDRSVRSWTERGVDGSSSWWAVLAGYLCYSACGAALTGPGWATAILELVGWAIVAAAVYTTHLLLRNG